MKYGMKDDILILKYHPSYFMTDMKKRKLLFGGHLIRGYDEEAHLYILESKVKGKKIRGRPRLT